MVSHVLPPAASGQAMVLHRLLRDIDPEIYCLITYKHIQDAGGHYSERLGAHHFELAPQLQIRRGTRYGLRQIRQAANACLSLFGALWYARQIARMVRRSGIKALVACTGDLVLIPACYVANRVSGVDLYLYMFDHYAQQWTNRGARTFARWIEPHAVRSARGVIAPNEFMADKIRRQYGVESILIRNPVEVEKYRSFVNQIRQSDGRCRIVYTGAIYEAQYDAFRNLIQAIKLSGNRNYTLHVYTSSKVESLITAAEPGTVFLHQHLPNNEMPAVQTNADILFLPLAFSSRYPEIIKTSAPGKVGEYLAAGRPILVHAPGDSFVSWYFRHHECGLVVSVSSPEDVSEGLEVLGQNSNLRETLVRNAKRRAELDFDLGVNERKFIELFCHSRKSRENTL